MYLDFYFLNIIIILFFKNNNVVLFYIIKFKTSNNFPFLS